MRAPPGVADDHGVGRDSYCGTVLQVGTRTQYPMLALTCNTIDHCDIQQLSVQTFEVKISYSADELTDRVLSIRRSESSARARAATGIATPSRSKIILDWLS